MEALRSYCSRGNAPMPNAEISRRDLRAVAHKGSPVGARKSSNVDKSQPPEVVKPNWGDVGGSWRGCTGVVSAVQHGTPNTAAFCEEGMERPHAGLGILHHRPLLERGWAGPLLLRQLASQAAGLLQ